MDRVKVLYCVTGYVQGVDGSVHIQTSAYSKAQAKLQAARTIERRLERKAYVGDLDVIEFNAHDHSKK